jgi:hypothetical protein
MSRIVQRSQLALAPGDVGRRNPGPIVDAEIRGDAARYASGLPPPGKRIEAVGLERVGQPHVKHLQDKLWEMRFSGRDGIGRAIYVTATGRRVVVVHAFVKKTRETPKAALALAERRAKEIKP